MFILENPYVSDLMLETLEKNQYEVLDTNVARDWNNKRFNLNFIDNSFALKKYEQKQKIYSNSENSVSFVTGNFKGSNLAEIIKICKDKYEFRNRLMPIYPNFFFEEVLLEDLENLDITEYQMPFIIKPTVGFLSMGVHKVSTVEQWFETVLQIKSEIADFTKNFPETVLNSSSFIIEEIIKGEEFAIDAYYTDNGEPVILNIFQHPFVNGDDVSDRAYISSKEIIESNISQFEELLSKIGKLIDMKDFPMHIEVIKKQNGEIIPVEINPMRCAGWCTTDLAYYAYGINIYEHFEKNLKPDWENILKDKSGKIYYFAITENPQDVDQNTMLVDYKNLKENFSKILEFREIDYKTKPVSAIIFGETENYQEITKILQLDMHNYISSN